MMQSGVDPMICFLFVSCADLLIIVVLRVHDDLIGDEVGGVETDTKLTDHAHVGTSGDGLHESLTEKNKKKKFEKQT